MFFIKWLFYVVLGYTMVYTCIHHCETVIDLLYCWFGTLGYLVDIPSNLFSQGVPLPLVPPVPPGVSIGHRGCSGWWRTCVSGGLVLGTDCEAEKPLKDHLRGWFKHVQHFAFVWEKNISLPAIFMFTTVLGFWFGAITLYTSHCPSPFRKFETTRTWGQDRSGQICVKI